MKKSKQPEMTPWTNTAAQAPTIIGEYNASKCRCEQARRWWDGEMWSLAYYKDDPETLQNARARTKIGAKAIARIDWRGLAEDPSKGPSQ
jgi:hypothetical protein